MRTPEEKDRQIRGLQATREKLPEYNFFGDNNWAAIDAQISIIRGNATLDNFEEDDDYVYGEAQSALDWLEGVSDEDLYDVD